jgi:hypothetical protein
VLTVLGVSHLGEKRLRERLDGLGQSLEDVGDSVHRAALPFGPGEDVSERRPEPELTVSDRDDRCPYLAVAQVS